MELYNYWLEHPPVHVLLKQVAAAFGVRWNSGKGRNGPSLVEQQLLDSAGAAARPVESLPQSVQEWLRGGR